MKKVLIVIVFVLSFTFLNIISSIAQCHVQKTVNEKFGSIYNQAEVFYRNGDKVVIGNIFFITALKDSGHPTKVTFQLQYIYKGFSNRVELRKIDFNFKNNKTLTLNAESLDVPELEENELGAETGYFNIGKVFGENSMLLGNDPLESIIITDTRTNKTITMTPYDKILAEQFQCLLKYINDRR